MILDLKKAVGVGVLSMLLAVSTATAEDCAHLWRDLPRADDIIGMDGTVEYGDVLDILKIDSHTYVPIFYRFSSKQTVGPSFGAGWSLPILDATALNVDQNVYQTTFADGSSVLLEQDRNDPSKLNGPASGEILGNVIRVRLCNWTFHWIRGRIAKMVTPEGTVVDIVRGPAGTTVAAQGKIILQTELTEDGRRIKSMIVNGRKHDCQYEIRPIIAEVQGKPLVVSTDQCLSSIERNGKQVRSFQYSDADNPARLTPRFVIGHEADRAVEWDWQTGQIVKDRDCTVEVKVKGPETIEITRKRGDGAFAFLKIDYQRGAVEERDFTGSHLAYQFFVSGILSGKLREIKTATLNQTPEIKKFIYNEKADLVAIREPKQ